MDPKMVLIRRNEGLNIRLYVCDPKKMILMVILCFFVEPVKTVFFNWLCLYFLPLVMLIVF